MDQQHRRATLFGAGIIGNLIEIYDVAIYGFFAGAIAQNFFPFDSKTTALVNTFAIFLFGFIMRPVGAIFFGHIGDKYSRKSALLWSIVLMALATSFIGLIPNYHHLGMIAPVLLIITRLLQGFSLGGEYSGSVILLTESAPKQRRGFWGSIATMGSNSGTLVASLVSFILSQFYTSHAIHVWAWRLPFLLVLFLGTLGYFLRRHLHLQEVSVKTKALPILVAFKENKRVLLKILGITWVGVVVTYTCYVYMVTYMASVLHYSFREAMLSNTLSLVLVVAIIPLGGYLSDHYGRKKILYVAIMSTALFIYPYFMGVNSHYFTLALAGQLMISIPFGLYFSCAPTMMAEMTPKEVRYTVVSLGYNLGASVFGGTTPLVMTLLLYHNKLSVLPAFYILFCVGIAFVAIYSALNHMHADD